MTYFWKAKTMICRYLLLSTLLLAPTALMADAAKIEERDLVLGIDETLDTVVNDQIVTLRIAPDAVSVPTLNAASAQRVDLKASLREFGYVIGPTTIMFKTDRLRYYIDSDSQRVRTAFSELQVIQGADGVAGPEAFPFRRVILKLRDPTQEDEPLTFPIEQDTGRSQTGIRMEVDGAPVYVAFSFERAESLITATGARWIADKYGGRFAGDVSEMPILYGVSRPVRSLVLDRPLMLGELEISNLVVRVPDIGKIGGIPDENSENVDLNEIVVTANSGRKLPTQRLYIGMDTIGHCASITYDFELETVTLHCPPQNARKVEN